MTEEVSHPEDIYIRNLTTLPVRYRVPSKDKPYHIELERRGEIGDTTSIPYAISRHAQFRRVEGLFFEQVSDVEADANLMGHGVVEDPEYYPRGPKMIPVGKRTVIRNTEENEHLLRGRVQGLRTAFHDRIEIIERSANPAKPKIKSRLEHLEPAKVVVPGSEGHSTNI
jgi:hypothetical protein